MMNRLQVAQLGKVVGLKGDLKLHNKSDFIEQFKVAAVFTTQNNLELKISSFDKKNMLVRFVGYEDREVAQKLTNSELFSSLQATKDNCKLKKDEHFWFEIIGCEVIEEGEVLGVVSDIERIGVCDYLHVDTCEKLLQLNLSKTFMIPYIERYIINADVDSKVIKTNFAKELLESL